MLGAGSSPSSSSSCGSCARYRPSAPAALQLYGDDRARHREALEAELGPGQELAARLAAAALLAGLRVAEETAAARMEQDGRGLTAAEIDRLLDGAVAFAEAGVSAVATG